MVFPYRSLDRFRQHESPPPRKSLDCLEKFMKLREDTHVGS
jgi:hypothetical protein